MDRPLQATASGRTCVFQAQRPTFPKSHQGAGTAESYGALLFVCDRLAGAEFGENIFNIWVAADDGDGFTLKTKNPRHLGLVVLSQKR